MKSKLMLAFFCSVVAFAAQAEDRTAPMMADCKKELGLTPRQCTCIFTESMDTNLSNVDLSLYYANNRQKLSKQRLATADALKKKCTAQKSSARTTPVKSPAPSAALQPGGLKNPGNANAYEKAKADIRAMHADYLRRSAERQAQAYRDQSK